MKPMSNLPWISFGKTMLIFTLKAPSGTSTCNPFARIASMCSLSTSTKVMSRPARASRPPIMPPIGPVPMTIMRMIVRSFSVLFSNHSYLKFGKAVN